MTLETRIELDFGKELASYDCVAHHFEVPPFLLSVLHDERGEEFVVKVGNFGNFTIIEGENKKETEIDRIA